MESGSGRERQQVRDTHGEKSMSPHVAGWPGHSGGISPRPHSFLERCQLCWSSAEAEGLMQVLSGD